MSAGFTATSSGTLSTDTNRFGDGNNNWEFIERFQRLKALYNLIKEKLGTRTYPHSNQWYINKYKTLINIVAQSIVKRSHTQSGTRMWMTDRPP